MFETMFQEGSITPVGVACIALFGVNIALRVSRSFKRDAQGSTFGDFFSSFKLLSNTDSVLKREEVENSVNNYEKLFSGARKETGKVTSEESIKTRQKEYETMVDSFYNLVTDFYEWGWGQVRPAFC